MATINIDEIRVASSYQGEPRLLSGPEAATQTFLKGAPLAWNGGYLEEAGADPAAIVGIAAEDGHNSTNAGDDTITYVPLAGNVFEANLAQAAANTTSAATNLGTAYGIVKRTTGTAHWVVDSSDTTNTRCRPLRFTRGSVAGDVNARINITFFNANDGLTA